MVIRRRWPFCPRLRMRRMNTLVYTDVRKIPDLKKKKKKPQVSWMCFIIINDLYMAHHNSLGICRQLKIRHLYGIVNFSTQCIYVGTGSLFANRFSSFLWKSAPSTKENGICGSVNCFSYRGPVLHLTRWLNIPRSPLRNCIYSLH